MKRKIILYAAVLCVFFANSIPVMAAGNYKVLQIAAGEEQVTAYIEGDTDINAVTCQIGMTPCEDVKYTTFSEENITFHTIVLFDNSLSVSEENKEKAKDILTSYFANKGEREYVTLATFGETVEILADHTSDAEILTEALDKIVHTDRDTYLTDVLYEYLDTVNNEEYTRFIVMSDGVDNKSIGITKEELFEKLEKNPHPVYTLGHIYKNNDEQLENMFALSRATDGNSYLIDEIENVSAIAEELVNVKNLFCVKADIPQAIRDGSSKSLLFTIENAAGISEVKTEAEMPFSIEEETQTVEPTTVEETKPVETTEEETEPVTETMEETVAEQEVVSEEENDRSMMIPALVVIVAAVLLWMQWKKGKKDSDKKESKGKKEKKSKKEEKGTPKIPAAMPVMETQPYIPDAEATVILERRYMLVLRDIHDPEKLFKYPLDQCVAIGRNVDKVNIAIDYNKTVSGRHCEISVRNNHFYIRDLNSSNKTYVNGQAIQTETEIRSGCMIALGEVELSLEIIPM